MQQFVKLLPRTLLFQVKFVLHKGKIQSTIKAFQGEGRETYLRE